ncbi:MAG: hypothetical protein ACE5NA_04455 [Nitrospiraceae bacterium]
MEITRDVAVMMSFGGGQTVERRRAILDFARIKYLVEEKINVPTKGTENKIKYKVDVYNLQVGQIPEAVVRGIATADILIGLLTEKNVNVIYELAVRNLLKDELLLMVKGDPEELVPIYLKDMAYIEYTGGETGQVADRIDKIANDQGRELYWGRETPDDLERAINSDDRTLQQNLEKALNRIEINTPKRPAYILDLVTDLDPGKLLSNWITYYRYGVVRIKWKRKSGGVVYLPEDMEGKPVFTDAGPRFHELFHYPQRMKLPDPDSGEALTVEKLLTRIRTLGIINPKDYEALIEDQKRVTREILYEDGYGRAEVPLRFNRKHRTLANRAYLPTLVAKRTLGDTRRHHATYLLVIYYRIDQNGGVTPPLETDLLEGDDTYE